MKQSLPALALASILAIAVLVIWMLGVSWVVQIAKLNLRSSNTQFVTPMSVMADGIHCGAEFAAPPRLFDRVTSVTWIVDGTTPKLGYGNTLNS